MTFGQKGRMAFRKAATVFSTSLTCLEPTIETEAIVKLSDYLKDRFAARGWSKEAKPEAVTCFDTSGSGKTTTVKEAAAKTKANRIVISPMIYPELDDALLKCSAIGTGISEESVASHVVEEKMRPIFKACLSDLFLDIAAMLKEKQDQEGILNDKILCRNDKEASRTSSESFRLLQLVLGQRNLIIHVDDCQAFFGQLAPAPRRTIVYVDQIRTLALRSFSDAATCFAGEANICWVFTGTLPNLKDEIRLVTAMETYDISHLIPEFNTKDVLTVICHYYNLPAQPSSDLSNCAERLCGPPKNTLLFLRNGLTFNLSSCEELTKQWEYIESKAIEDFKGTITTSLRGDLDAAARSICSLYTACCLSSGHELTCDTVPAHLTKLVNCGLLRIRAAHRGWSIRRPSRLLVNFLQRYVSWFTWANVGSLTSAINTATSIKTVNGKFFEFLFALEICGPPNSKLWHFLATKANIRALDDVSYSISQKFSGLSEFKDETKVYVVIDPDTKNTKVDVAFFAQKPKEDGVEKVRVLVQLTVQKEVKAIKIKDAFDAMLGLPAMNGISDVRLFIGPSGAVKWVSDAILADSYVSNKCFCFQKDSGIEEQFQLPLDIMCYSEVFDEDRALNSLTALAQRLGDWDLAVDIDKRLAKRQRTVSAPAPVSVVTPPTTSSRVDTGASSGQAFHDAAAAIKEWLLKYVPEHLPIRRGSLTDDFCQNLAACSVSTTALEMVREDSSLLNQEYLPRLRAEYVTILKMMLKPEHPAPDG